MSHLMLVHLHKLSRIPPGGHLTYVSDKMTESWRPLHPLIHFIYFNKIITTIIIIFFLNSYVLNLDLWDLKVGM